ncbi:MAG: carbohydrate ABC transporter permease [Acutalibacteraceae bacterium]
MHNRKSIVAQTFLHLILIALLFIMLYPLAMALWNAFKSELGFAYTRWYPTLPLRVTNFSTVFPSVWRYILNTVIVAAAGTCGMLFIASLAAFSFARMRFPGREFFYMMVIALMMIPGILTVVPTYMMYKSMGLLNSYWVLILPIIFGGSVFGMFLLRSFFQSIPEDVFEAARIDGATEFRVYRSVCIPMSLPIMGTLAIIQINSTWNDYVWPMITIKDYDIITISAGLLMRFVQTYSTNYPLQFAAYLLSSLPLILLFIFANKYYVEGMISSAIKM